MTVTTKNGVIKMPDAGDTVTMHVVRCEVVEGQYGEQIKFTDTRGDALYLPRESGDRQLGRIGFADGEMVIYGDVDGQTLIFSRDPNPKAGAKPYWGIRRVTEDSAHRPSLAAAAKAEAERVRQAKHLPREEDGNLGPHIPGLDDDVPPPDDADSPYDEDGMPPVKVVAAPQGQSKAEQYFALARQVADFQAEIGDAKECPFDLASINAMTFSIWNSR